MFGLFGKSSYMVGLDIGASSVKAVKLGGTRGGVRLEFACEYPLYRDGVKAEAVELVSSIFREHGLKHDKAVVLFPCEKSYVYQTQLPVMPAGELKEAVYWEASKLLAIPVDEAVMDYTVAERADRKYQVTIAAAKKNDVVSVAGSLRKNGVNVMIIDVSPLAITKALQFTGGEDPGGVRIFTDMGYSKMEIGIALAGSLVFYRVVKSGGDAITKKVMDIRQSDYKTAEQIKKDTGLTGDMLDVKSVIQDEIDKAVLELRRSLDYFRGQYREQYISEIILSGGMAEMPGLASYLHDYFELPVRIADPLATITEDKNLRKPVFLPALGAALRQSA